METQKGTRRRDKAGGWPRLPPICSPDSETPSTEALIPLSLFLFFCGTKI
jgi:hypothetical protein